MTTTNIKIQLLLGILFYNSLLLMSLFFRKTIDPKFFMPAIDCVLSIQLQSLLVLCPLLVLLISLVMYLPDDKDILRSAAKHLFLCGYAILIPLFC